MPLMGSRGGGSVRGFGRFGKVLLLSLLDVFNRSTSGTLGTSSDGKGVWKNVRGTWSANGSSAVNSDAASNNNIAVVDMDGANITNVQVDVQSAGGGTGVSFWVQDSNNYYALYPTYSTSSQTVTNCGGSSGSGSSLPGGACGVGGSGCGQWYNYCYYAGRVEYTGSAPGCNIPSSWPGILDKNCGPGWYYVDCKCSSYNWAGQNQTSSLTNYESTVKLLRVQGGSGSEIVSSTYTNNTSGYNRTRSVAISTSGNTITYALYSSTNKGGSVLASGNTSPSSPVKGLGVGVFKGSSTTEQGSAVNAFSATVTP
jgi:hypothetical protein